MFKFLFEASRGGLMAQYNRYHAIMSTFQRVISDTLKKIDYQRAAQKLELLQSGGVCLGSDQELCVLMDFAIYGMLDGKNATAVMRYEKTHPQAPGSDEEMILSAMTHSRHCVLQVKKRVPDCGVECRDILRDEDVFVANHGFGATMMPGIILASRLVSTPEFEMSTGADIPVSDAAFEVISRVMDRSTKDLGYCADTLDDRVVAREFASLIIATCLLAKSDFKVVHLNLPGEGAPSAEAIVRALPAEGISRNRECPCGSGLKYKRCCGELMRR